MTNRQIRMNTSSTSCIVHLADSANFKDITFNKLCNGLTSSCFESPNDTIHVTVRLHATLLINNSCNYVTYSLHLYNEEYRNYRRVY